MTTSATKSITLPVLGMSCAACQHHVEEALRATAGVESARVDLMAHRASVVFDPAHARPRNWWRRFARRATMLCFRAPDVLAEYTPEPPMTEPSVRRMQR